METRIIICGGIDFSDRETFSATLDRLLPADEAITLVSGHAKGADTFAEEYAAEHGIPIRVFPADWKRYGRGAGPIRNREMLAYAVQASPRVIAFWNGKSRGTGNMINLARTAGVACEIVYYQSVKG